MQVYFQSIFEVHFLVYLKHRYTSSIRQVYFKYTSSVLQPIELEKKKCTSSLCCFDKRSIYTFEAYIL